VRPADVTLARIEKALLGFFGVKAGPVERPDAMAKAKEMGLPTARVKKGDIEAWEKAGRPDPRKWFANRQVKNG